MLIMLSWAQLFNVAKNALACPSLLWILLISSKWKNFLLLITIPFKKASVDPWSLRYSPSPQAPWRKNTT